jgi:hypothetical protein
VFRSKRGMRLSQPTLSGYWTQVLARAGLDFDFYLATKHYGDGDVGALEEIDRAFKAKVTPLRAVDSDATGTQGGP